MRASTVKVEAEQRGTTLTARSEQYNRGAIHVPGWFEICWIDPDLFIRVRPLFLEGCRIASWQTLHKLN